MALLALCALTTPLAALANNVADAELSPVLGGSMLITIPADAHQVCKLHLRAGDWLIGYAWAPDTRNAAATIRVLGPSATDVASDTVAVSSPVGILFWQAPSEGAYYCDYSGVPGVAVSRGLFLSRPILSWRGARVIALPYNGSATLSCTFKDPLYSYVPFDGPTIGFERVGLSSSRDGSSWRRVFAGSTDVNGVVAHTVSGMKRRTVFSFDFGGAVYDSAGFGETRSAVVTVFPRFRITQTVRTRAKVGVAFIVSGTMQPTCPPGRIDAVVQAHKRGSRRVFSFAVRALSPRGSSSPIRASG